MVALDRNCPRRWRLARTLATFVPLLAFMLVGSSAAASSWVPGGEPLVSPSLIGVPALAMDDRGTAQRFGQMALKKACSPSIPRS